MNSLYSVFLNNNGRIIHKWKHYFPIYERHIKHYQNRPLTLLEIGCGKGGSLQMWKSWLGPHADIVGIDIQPQCKDYEEDQISIRIGDQSDTNFLAKVVEEFDPIDIIIDDGSHMMSDIQTSFSYLYPKIARNGLYLVEDLHTAYWEEYEGGLKREGSFIETIKDLIDQLNADHSRGAIPSSEFTSSTLSMHLYDSICVFEKGRHLKKRAFEIGRELD